MYFIVVIGKHGHLHRKCLGGCVPNGSPDILTLSEEEHMMFFFFVLFCFSKVSLNVYHYYYLLKNSLRNNTGNFIWQLRIMESK